MNRPYESEAASICCSIQHLAADESALSNLESYLAMHLGEWLEKHAATPEDFAEELHRFSTMFE